MNDFDILKEGHFGEYLVAGIFTSVSSHVDYKGFNQEHCGRCTNSQKRSQLRLWTRHYRRFCRDEWAYREVRDMCRCKEESLSVTVFAGITKVLRGKPCCWYVS